MLFNYFRNHFGGKKNTLLWAQDFIAWKLGKYSSAKHINWDLVKRVIFVCKGNICRSAYAEVYFTHTYPHIQTASCGVTTSNGEPANETAQEIAQERGLNLANHQTSRPEVIGISSSDLVVYMEPAHKIKFDQNITAGQTPQYTYLGIWGNNPPFIPDPYATSFEYFDNCFKLIEKSINCLAIKLEKNRKCTK